MCGVVGNLTISVKGVTYDDIAETDYEKTKLNNIVTEFVNEDGTVANVDNPTVTTVTSSTSAPIPTPVQTTSTRKPEQTCQASETKVLGRGKICKGALIFSEEFDDGSSKDLSNWDKEVKFPGEPVSKMI